MSTLGTYRIAEKKCATCSYWGGTLRIDFRAKRLFVLLPKLETTTCLADVNGFLIKEY